MRGLTALAGFALSMARAGVLAAAEPCFCLGDADDAVWYDCRMFHVGIDPNPQFECRPAPSKERITVEQRHTLQRYKAGEKPCVPCKVEPQPIDDQIRGDDSKEPDSHKEKPLARPEATAVDPLMPQ